MFKTARWRTDRNKIKAVFKLQFHATQVGQIGADALIVSVVPGDVGKPTLKLEKASVKNGCCRWENFVYETVKFVQDPRSGIINQKIYHFIVSNGSTKAGVLGEVSVDFANYSEAIKPAYVSIPLKNSNSNAVLHVSIQRVQENADKRETEDNEDTQANSQDKSLGIQLSNCDTDEIMKNSPVEGIQNENTAIQDPGINGVSRASSGSDITMSSSECSSGFDTPREPGPKNNALTTSNGEHERSQWGWPAGSDQGPTTDNSSTTSQGTLPSEKNEQCSDNEIEKLKAELQLLTRQVDMSELELQTLRKQIVKEGKRGQDLAKEIIILKEDRDAVKAENDKLKAFQKRMDDAKIRRQLQPESGDLRALVEEIRQELHYEKDLNANLRLQLQKTQEANSELIFAVQDLEEMLDKKNEKVSCLQENSRTNAEDQPTNFKCESDEDEEQRALEELVKEHKDGKDAERLEQRILDLNNEIEMHRRDKDELEMQMEQLALDYEILKQENHAISCKLEQSQLQDQLKMQCECSPFPDAHELEMQIDNLHTELEKQSKENSESLATISELETYIKSLEGELEKQAQGFKADLETITRAKVEQDTELDKQSKENLDSSATVSELETYIISLEEELEKQAQGFEADLETISRSKVEQEQRAIRAEEALRKTRWKNACTAEKLREEFKRLSLQMASSFEANEKMASKALTESSELRAEKSQLDEMLKKVNKEYQSMRDYYEAKCCDLSSQVKLKSDQLEQLKVETEKKSMQFDAEKRMGEEASEALSKEILMLKAEIEKLNTECNILSKEADNNEKLKADLEELRTLMDDAESLIQRGSVERNELKRTIAMLKGDAKKSIEELNTMRGLNDEKNRQIELLQSNLEEVKAQCSDFQRSLHEDESEKERLRKQVVQLKTELKKKEDAITNLEKKLKESHVRATILDGTKASSRKNTSAPSTQSLKEVAGLRERIRLLEGQIKTKETALQATTNSFLEKESDLQKKVDELESKLQELSQDSACTLEELEDTGKSTLNGNSDKNLSDILSEVESLKEKNNIMEDELKEMQERYSEISLKFAEVEGERQQLVMTLRNLKNTRKI